MDVADPKIDLDLATLHRSKLGSITAGIWLRFGEIAFPAARWSDFVVVILGWWTGVLQSNDRQLRLLFMDGPYLLRVIRGSSGRCSIEGMDGHGREERSLFSVEADFVMFRKGVFAAGRTVVEACRNKGWSSRDIDELAKLLEGSGSTG
jgi:hypothetical protein